MQIRRTSYIYQVIEAIWLSSYFFTYKSHTDNIVNHFDFLVVERAKVVHLILTQLQHKVVCTNYLSDSACRLSWMLTCGTFNQDNRGYHNKNPPF